MKDDVLELAIVAGGLFRCIGMLIEIPSRFRTADGLQKLGARR